MKPFIEKRNARMREDYRKAMKRAKNTGDQKASDRIISELVKRYAVFELTWETVRSICTNPNYGKERQYCVVYTLHDETTEGNGWVLKGDDEKAFLRDTVKDALKDGKKLLKVRDIKFKKIDAVLFDEQPQNGQSTETQQTQESEATV